MNKKATFVVNVLSAWLLVVGGMFLAGWLSTSEETYTLILVASLVPALLFIKFRLPVSWPKFGGGLVLLILIGLVSAILRKLEIKDDFMPMVIIGIVVIAGPLMNKGELQNNEVDAIRR